MKDRECFAIAARGLEEVLAREVEALGAKAIKVERGGVRFVGNLQQANLWLRTANRVLVTLDRFPCESVDQLYERVRKQPWIRLIPPDHTLAVDANVRDSFATHSGFIALRVKDAIVDTVRDVCGKRPSVNVRDPDVRVNVHLARNECSLSLDSSGAGLHQRGYRTEAGEAPLRETLAAGLVELSGWDGSIPLVDPMCGAGTILIEAALLALGRPPGANRKFSFQRWPKHRAIEASAGATARLKAPILGCDIDAKVVRAAQANCRRAGVEEAVQIREGDIRELDLPEPPGVLICNPPYGARLGEIEKLKGLYKQIGDTLKQRARGYTAFLFTGNLELLKSVGLRTSARISLFNGPIECRLARYEMY